VAEGGRGRTDGVSQRHASRARKVPAGPQASPPSDVPSSASQGREGEVGVNGGAGAAPDPAMIEMYPQPKPGESVEVTRLPAQTTVEEMLASCPTCAEPFSQLDDGTVLCGSCGYVREPS
jgi:hypothetical protein